MIYFDKILSEKSIENIIKKQVKTTGIRKLIIIAEDKALETFESQLRKQNLIGKGSYFLLKSTAIYSTSIEGSVVLVESGTENSTDNADYEFLSVSYVISKIDSDLKNIYKICPRNICSTSHKIINIQSGAKVQIGEFNEKLVINKPLIFPGNVTSTVSKQENTKLRLSIANGTAEIYNYGYYPTFAYWYLAATFAKEMSNSLSEIPNFEFEFFPTNCGNTVYDANWYKLCFSKLSSELGIGYLTGIWPSGALGNLLTLRSLGVKIPQITPYGMDQQLESKSVAPEILKLSLALDEFIALSFSLYFALEWKYSVMIFSDDSAYSSLFQQLGPYLTSLGVTILNEEKILTANYTRKDFNKYKKYFQDIKDLDCRIYIIFSTASAHIIEALYDVGVRKGESIIISDQRILENLEKTDDQDEFVFKREKLLVGGFTFLTLEFVGDY